jgi:pyruvate dehydrogenase E2 component (dihydrolipoamide acetyltransferase)
VIASDVREALAGGQLGAGAGAGAAAGAGARGGFADTAHSALSRAIAQRLTFSKQSVPHYTLTCDINLDALLALRGALNADLKDAPLSLNDFLVKAAALALRRVPEMNSSWLDAGIRTYDYVDVAVAVAAPAGLLTPVVEDADAKGLLAISRCAVAAL